MAQVWQRRRNRSGRHSSGREDRVDDTGPAERTRTTTKVRQGRLHRYGRDDNASPSGMKGMTTQVLKGCKGRRQSHTGPADTKGMTTQVLQRGQGRQHRSGRYDRWVLCCLAPWENPEKYQILNVWRGKNLKYSKFKLLVKN